MTKTVIPKIGDIVCIIDEKGSTQEEVVISVKNRFKNECRFYFKEHGRSDSHHSYTLNDDGKTWKYSGACRGDLQLRSEVKVIGHMNNIDYFDDYINTNND